MTSGSSRGVDTAGVAIALGLIVIAAVIGYDAATLQISSVYGLGPKAMPLVVAGGLGILGALNLVIALRSGPPQREQAAPLPLLLILGGLVALIAIIRFGGGFVPATAVLFAATATAFGRRRVLIDLLIGFGLGFVAYLIFAKLLALSLPVGPLERLLG